MQQQTNLNIYFKNHINKNKIKIENKIYNKECLKNNNFITDSYSLINSNELLNDFYQDQLANDHDYIYIQELQYSEEHEPERTATPEQYFKNKINYYEKLLFNRIIIKKEIKAFIILLNNINKYYNLNYKINFKYNDNKLIFENTNNFKKYLKETNIINIIKSKINYYYNFYNI